MHEGESEYQLDRLLFKQRLLSSQLQEVSCKIERLESNHLSRWHAGNLYLSFHPQLAQNRRRLELRPPPQAKLFSTSDTLSSSAAQLDFRNQRIMPIEVERHLEKERLKLCRRQADRARHARSHSSGARRP